MTRPSWSDRIRDARAARGVTLDALADACGVSRPTAIDWEKGVGPGPRIASIPGVCAVLGISPHWLIYGREPDHALDVERKAHEETRRLLSDSLSEHDALQHFATRCARAEVRAAQAEASLSDVRQRCGGYPDSRVDGDGGIVAVVVRERDKAQARAERAEARCAALGTDPSVPMERPSVLATMAERLGVAESERDEAQAALVVLREACRKPLRVLDKLDVDEWSAFDDALAATPATLAGQVRARVLREAADLVDSYARSSAKDRNGMPLQTWLRALADEAEKAK